MRTLLAVMTALLLAPATALAGAQLDKANGSGKQSIPPGTEAFLTHISFSARAEDPLTTVAKGHFVGSGSLAGSPFSQQGDVTCLRVEGNQASIRYRFDKASGATAPFEGGGIQIFVQDNPTKPDASNFDQPEPRAVFDAHADVCDDPRTRTYDPIDSGNFVVRDSSP